MPTLSSGDGVKQKHGPQLARLAFRVEGEYINAYFAKPDTMVDAQLLGSLSLGVANDNPPIGEGFKALMRGAMAEIVFKATGMRIEWGGDMPAPESERSSKAGHG